MSTIAIDAGPVLPDDLERIQFALASSLCEQFEEEFKALGGEWTEETRGAFIVLVSPWIATQDMFVTSHEIRASLRKILDMLGVPR